MKIFSFLFFALVLSTVSFAQVRKIPAAVTDAFSKQYPTALDVEYRDQLTGFNVEFLQDSIRMVAKYNNKGDWKETDKEWSFDKLSPEVRDGYQKSKYTEEWKVTETMVIFMPGGSELYRLKVEKNDLQKKYLFFNTRGRLVRDSLTI